MKKFLNKKKKACLPACFNERSTSGRHCYARSQRCSDFGQAKRYRRGFSLIEVLVAMFVLLVGILGTMVLFTGSIKNSIDSRDHIIAAALAQEGIELVRNMRYNDAFNGLDFANGTRLPAISYDNCVADYTFSSIPSSDCVSSSSKTLNLNSSGFYIMGAGTPTKFQRKIKLAYNAAGDQLTVTSTVLWGSYDFSAPCDTAHQCASTDDVLTNQDSPIYVGP